MRKIFMFMMVVMLVLTLTVSVGATEYEEPMTEASTVSETEPDTDDETSHEEADTEISDLLEGATPEQIENIKQYILYGISALPFPDQVRVFATENLNAIAWFVAGILFLASLMGLLRMRKKWTADVKTMTDNAVEIADQAQECIEEAKAEVVSISKANKAMLEEVRADIKMQMEDAERRNALALAEARESTAAAIKTMTELKNGETGLTEAEILLATIVHDLVQNSSLPEWKKDEFTVHLNQGLEKIREVTEHDEA